MKPDQTETRRRATRYSLTAALAAALLTGCAVLEIDVDVYKGPLANEDDVKTEQYASMAIGAKPILVQLRDKLQWEKEEARKNARTSKCYIPGFMKVEKGKFTNTCVMTYGNKQKVDVRITDEKAMRVNNVLWLYEDDQSRSQKFKEADLAEKIISEKVTKIVDTYQASSKTLMANASPSSDEDRNLTDQSGSQLLPLEKNWKLPETIRNLERWNFERLLIDEPLITISDKGEIKELPKEINIKLSASLSDEKQTAAAGLLSKAYSYIISDNDPTALALLSVWAKKIRK